MKKLIVLLLAAIILITGCQKEIPVLDFVQSNAGSNAFNPIMETNIGYYYNSVYYKPMSIHYYDKETGTTIYLCSKPECTHDGSNFCAATNGNLKTFNTAMYGDALYVCGIVESDKLSLYRASLDGTEFTKLVDFATCSYSFLQLFGDSGGLIIHRGKAFVPCYSYDSNDIESGIGNIVMIDLATLKCEIIAEIAFKDYSIIQNTMAAGDYLYYLLTKNGTQNTYLKRYNILTKETEELPVNERINSYAVIGDEVWYSVKFGTIGKSADEPKILIYNTISGETTKFEIDLTHLVELENQILNSGDVIVGGDFYVPYNDIEIMYDGEYLYVSKDCRIRLVGFESSGEASNISIYNLKGEELGQFSHEYKGKYCINVLNGKVYFQTEEFLDSCSVEDILDGRLKWETEFKFNDMAVTDFTEQE